MKRNESVIHGSTSTLNQPTGSFVSGTYPGGGTHEKRNVWWSRFCVSRFTTSPTQNTGMESATRPSTITSTSIAVPRKTAASTPMTMLTTTQMSAAPITSESVTGAASVI